MFNYVEQKITQQCKIPKSPGSVLISSAMCVMCIEISGIPKGNKLLKLFKYL